VLCVWAWLLVASVVIQHVQGIDVKSANLVFEQAKRDNEYLRKSYELATTMCNSAQCSEVVREFLDGDSDYYDQSPAAKLLKRTPDRALFVLYESAPFMLQKVHESLLRLRDAFGVTATSPLNAPKPTAKTPVNTPKPASAGHKTNHAQQDEL